MRAPATLEWHAPGSARRYNPITANALVDRGFAVFTKFGTRPSRPGLIPTELELLETPVVDENTRRPTIPGEMLAAEELWNRAIPLLREAGAQIRIAYPAHSLIPFRRRVGKTTITTVGRVMRHDGGRFRCSVLMPSGRAVHVPYVDVMRAVLGGRFEAPVLDSDSSAVL